MGTKWKKKRYPLGKQRIFTTIYEDEKSPSKNQHVTSKKRGIIHLFLGVFFPTPPLLNPHFYDVIEGLFSSSTLILTNHDQMLFKSFCSYSYPGFFVLRYLLMLSSLFLITFNQDSIISNTMI